MRKLSDSDQAYRDKLLRDQSMARDQAELCFGRQDLANHARKLKQVRQFDELIKAFDEWKPKIKVKKEADNDRSDTGNG